ncbi:uncharacterized protein GGS22DRAFT_199434 [Annulohypoxylon maeteangense]|uniref:uncharacterized protein n=1 Tax=Annulohypoxylon maeteangense TaxID=1927788 RepID=UPI0020087CF7|nr:uncharacterized protein GGS22DRAFT_199434 [Annulohypoxylon maeteangense]KAI0886019.1 hypothetical protein GGS22DRAFT_199434 [Annulohypoxylon maeteangense]
MSSPVEVVTATIMQSVDPAEVSAATIQAIVAAIKPDLDRFEKERAHLQSQCQDLWVEKDNMYHQATMEVSRLTEASKAQKGAIERAKKVLKGVVGDRHRVRVDNRRLKLKIAQLEQSYGMMVIDVDVGAEAECARLEAKNAALEDELKGLQAEYMELVEKSEEEQKSASAMLSQVQDQAVKDAASQVATAKEEMEKVVQEMRTKMETQVTEMQVKMETQVTDMKVKVKAQVAEMKVGMEMEMKEEAKEFANDLHEKYTSQMREHCAQFKGECQYEYEKELTLTKRGLFDRLCWGLQFPPDSSPTDPFTPDPFTPGPSVLVTPSTRPSTPPSPLSSPPDFNTPPTPTPPTRVFSKTGRYRKECNSSNEALALAREEHYAVQDAATLVLQKALLEDSIKRFGVQTKPAAEVAPEEANHEYVPKPALLTIQDLGEVEQELKSFQEPVQPSTQDLGGVEQELKNALGQRRLQQRRLKRGDETRKGGMSKRRSNQ